MSDNSCQTILFIKCLDQQLRILKMRFILPFISLFIISCRNNETKETNAATLGQAEIWCDENLKSIISQQEEVFEFSYKYSDLKINYVSENIVKEKFLAGDANVIISSIVMDSNLIKKLNTQNIHPRQFPFGKSAIAFITQKGNDLNLSYESLIDKLSGKNTDFIFAIEGKESGIANDILGYLKQTSLGSNVYALESKEAILNWLKKNKNGIGIIDWSEVSDSDDPLAQAYLNAVSLIGISSDASKGEFIKPYQYGLNGLYPFNRQLTFIRKYGLTDVTLGFASFICSERGQKIMLKAGLLPEYQYERWIEFKGLKEVEAIK